MTNEEAYSKCKIIEKLKEDYNEFIDDYGLLCDDFVSVCEENEKLKDENEMLEMAMNKQNDVLLQEIERLKVEIKKAMPFEFGQKLYSIETWEDTGDSTIFEYEFDGVEADGIRLIYQGNKEDVCVFSLDEIGVNIFESMDEAEKVLKKEGADE